MLEQVARKTFEKWTKDITNFSVIGNPKRERQ
jgi:hypothetical protein